MNKTALLGHIMRVMRQDIPGTPRLLLDKASPEQLGGIQSKYNNLFGPFKEKAKALPGFLHKPVTFLMDHPEVALAAPLPIPGASVAAMAAKKGLEHGIDYLAPLPKVAFSTNQFSGPMNPDIRSGASDLPAFRAPRLDRAIQKNSGSITPLEGPARGDLVKAGEVDEFLSKLASMGVGQWWEQVGGPHLAKGGKHSEFKKMMEQEGIPPGVQEKFMHVAKQKYPEGYNKSQYEQRTGAPPGPGGGWSPPGYKRPDAPGWDPEEYSVKGQVKRVLKDPANIVGGLAALGLGGRLAVAKGTDDSDAAPQRWKGRLGAHMALSSLPVGGYQIGRALGGNKGSLYGGLVGAGLNAALGTAALHEAERQADTEGRRAAKTEGGQARVLREAGKSSAGIGRKALGEVAPAAAIGSVLMGGRTIPLEAGWATTTATGAGLLGRYRNLSSAKAMHKELAKPKEKAAASAPTRGNFMMASDIPSFQAPRLDRAIQKNSGETTMPTGTAGTDNPSPENTGKQSAFLPDGVTANSNDFKPAKLAEITTAELAVLTAELLKEADVSPAASWNGGTFGGTGVRRGVSDIPPFRAPRLDRALQKTAIAGLTPASQLEKSTTVGAPKVTAPAGPSIADQVKPRGARFGSALPGAQKGGIGGYVLPSMK